VYRHLVITHRVRLFTVRLKRLRARGLVLWPILIVHLEVQNVARDQAKEQPVVVEPDSAEHSFRRDLANASELVHDVVEIFFADWHGKRSLEDPAGLYGSPSRRASTPVGTASRECRLTATMKTTSRELV